MKIAVEGCCHGELDAIYSSLQTLEQRRGIKVDLLLICGDFQSVRNTTDMTCMAVPPKYQAMNTFHKYYSGEAKAPVLTIFVGGNHEASNYLQELPYGGWVAPNIYYMGYAGVVQIGGIRIGGLSGISKERDYCKGRYEHPPYDENTKRSVYHVRNLDVFRLSQIKRPLDICLSHDWPRGVYECGDKESLLRWKKHFIDEVAAGTLGSGPARELLSLLQPQYWFAAHLHCKFAAHVQHPVTNGGPAKTTKFLALDKCLPRRNFLQVLDIPHDQSKPLRLQLDAEWLVILKTTNHLLNLKPTNTYLPGPGSAERWDFTVTEEEMEEVLADFGGNLIVPDNFEVTAPIHDPSATGRARAPAAMIINPQTKLLCTMLDITNPFAVFLDVSSSYSLEKPRSQAVSASQNPDEISLDDDDDNDDDAAESSSGHSSTDSQDADQLEEDEGDEDEEEEEEDGEEEGVGFPPRTPLTNRSVKGKFRTPRSLLKTVLKAQMRSAHLSPSTQKWSSTGNEPPQSSATGQLTKSFSTPARFESSSVSHQSPATTSSSQDIADDDEELASILALQRKALGKIEDKLSGLRKESSDQPADTPPGGAEDPPLPASSTPVKLSTSTSAPAVGEEVSPIKQSATGDNSLSSPGVTSPGEEPTTGVKRGEEELPPVPTSSAVKRFKRRNQEMYSQPEDEDA